MVTEGGLSMVAHDSGMDDVLLRTCGPAELEARIKPRSATCSPGARPQIPRRT